MNSLKLHQKKKNKLHKTAPSRRLKKKSHLDHDCLSLSLFGEGGRTLTEDSSSRRRLLLPLLAAGAKTAVALRRGCGCCWWWRCLCGALLMEILARLLLSGRPKALICPRELLSLLLAT